MSQSIEMEGRAQSDDQPTTAVPQPSSKLVRFYSHPWTQIILISFICFCLPGVRPLSESGDMHLC